MAKIKILYVITKGRWGGAGRYVYDIATNLPLDQFEVAVVVGPGEELPAKLAAHNIRVIRLGAAQRDINAQADSQTLLGLIKLFRAEKPDIIHLNSPKVGGLGAVAARFSKPRAKVVYTAHGWSFNEQRPQWQQMLIKLFSWLTVLLCDEVIVISQSELQAVAHWPGTKHKCTQIYNGIITPAYLTPEEARAVLQKNSKLALNSDNLLIGTIAELHPNKGLRNLIAAMPTLRARQPKAKLIIIGEGEQRAVLERDIITLGLSQHVFLAGQLDTAAQYLPAFDMFCLPSVKEGLPYVLLEAGLASLPVVATKVGGVGEIVTNNSTGLLVPANNITALAQALNELLGDVEKRKNFGSQLKLHVEQHFSLAHMLAKTLEIYAKPITSRSSASR
jgi:glycosyltransferase involved in cell wall biosynthesis